LYQWRHAAQSGRALAEARGRARNPRGKTRAAYSDAERVAAVTAYRHSGLTQRAFAKTWGLSIKTLSGWLAREQREGSTRPGDASARPTEGLTESDRGVAGSVGGDRGDEGSLSGFWPEAGGAVPAALWRGEGGTGDGAADAGSGGCESDAVRAQGPPVAAAAAAL